MQTLHELQFGARIEPLAPNCCIRARVLKVARSRLRGVRAGLVLEHARAEDRARLRSNSLVGLDRTWLAGLHAQLVLHVLHPLDTFGDFHRSIDFRIGAYKTAQLHHPFFGLDVDIGAFDIRRLQQRGLDFGCEASVIDILADFAADALACRTRCRCRSARRRWRRGGWRRDRWRGRRGWRFWLLLLAAETGKTSAAVMLIASGLRIIGTSKEFYVARVMKCLRVGALTRKSACAGLIDVPRKTHCRFTGVALPPGHQCREQVQQNGLKRNNVVHELQARGCTGESRVQPSAL